MLVGVLRASGLGARISGIENILLHSRHISRKVVGFPPVGVLDNHLNLGIDCLGGLNATVLGYILHKASSEGHPVVITLFPDTSFAGTISKIKIVQNNFIKETCGVFANFFEPVSHSGIGITESLKKTLFAPFRTIKIVDGGGNAAGYFYTFTLKKVLNHKELFFVHVRIASVGLKVDLVKADVFFQKFVIAFKLVLSESLRNLRRNIHYGLKVFEMSHFCPPKK